MPTYEYHCDACEHGFDEFQSMKDEPLKKCPKCGKRKLRQIFGAGAAIIFKGSGFYQTDYRSESYKKAATADKESSTPAAKTGTNGTAGKDGSAAKDAPAGNATSSEGKSTKSSGKNAKSDT